MTVGTGPPVDLVLASLSRELSAGERALALVGEPVRTARSTLYTVRDRSSGIAYVVKVPGRGNGAVDTEPPLEASAQFAALQRAHAWCGHDGHHAVARPVALLEDLAGVVTEHVPGPTVGALVHRGTGHPSAAARAAGAAGRFARSFHRHAAREEGTTSLATLVREVAAVEDELLVPVGVRLPQQVHRALDGVPGRDVRVRRVLLHGDYVPDNLILPGRHRVVMIDPLLTDVGLPEDDLARFLAVVSSDPAFLPGAVALPVRAVRRSLEQRFRAGYGTTPVDPAVLELRVLRQLGVRWRRRREFSALTSPALVRARAHLVDVHMRTVLRETAARLTQALARGSLAPHGDQVSRQGRRRRA